MFALLKAASILDTNSLSLHTNSVNTGRKGFISYPHTFKGTAYHLEECQQLLSNRFAFHSLGCCPLFRYSLLFRRR